MERRTVLRGGLVGAGAVASAQVIGCGPAPVPPVPPGLWDCGVASGLHSHDAAVLWTRSVPGAEAAVELVWEVATDPSFTDVVQQGRTVASPETDGCAKVLAQGLAAGRTHWYRFLLDGEASPTGRTRTLAAPGAATASVRLAVTSCQKFSAGFYPAWRAIAEEDLDGVLHLGDYIYESSSTDSPGSVRDDGPAANDLASYRAKYRWYRRDPDLRAAHAAHGFAPIWDDHEFVNDYDRTTLLDQPDRAADAYRAWFEYQPVWRTEGDRIHRRLRWGDLVDLSLLDTRQYRDPEILDANGDPVGPGFTNTEPLVRVHDPDRTILGQAQRDWLLDGLGAAQGDGVRWKLIGNQVMISPIRLIDLDEPALRAIAPELPRHAGLYFNFDDWSGFMAERDRVTTFLRDEGVSDVGIVTGDIHSFWQSDVLADFDEPGSPVVAQEFVCGSVSSTSFDSALGDFAREIEGVLRSIRPPFRYVSFSRGFGLLECTPDSTTVDFRTVNAFSRTSDATTWARFGWPSGSVPSLVRSVG